MVLRPIYYDTETTGLKWQTDKIIELAAYDPVNDKTFETLINPQTPIPKEATAIHHITDNMVKDAPLLAKAANDFVEFLGTDFVLIAHNNDGFDKYFMEAAFKELGIDISCWKYIDSLKWARKYRRDLPSHKLQYLREVYGILANQAHRALDDVMVLYEVFSKMIDDLPMEKVINLIYNTGAPAQKSGVMTFGKHQGKPLGEVPPGYVAWMQKSELLDKEEHRSLKEEFQKLGLLKQGASA